MDIDRRHKYAHLNGIGAEIFIFDRLFDNDYFAISRSNNCKRLVWSRTGGISKKIKDEESRFQQQQHNATIDNRAGNKQKSRHGGESDQQKIAPIDRFSIRSQHPSSPG